MTRYALRTDANQTAVVSALEAAGATVEIIGLPVDLLIGINGRFAFLECKDGAKSPSRRKKTKVQEAFFAKFPESAGYPVFLVDSPECALRYLRILQS